MHDAMKKIKDHAWKQIWAGSWNLLNVSDWGEFYLSGLECEGKIFLNQIIFFIKDGKSSGWAVEKEVADFSNHLARVFGNDKEKVKKLAIVLKQSGKTALDFMVENKSNITPQIYRKYQELIRKQYIPHVTVKYMVDGLSPENLKIFLPILEEARVAVEPVFKMTLEFDECLAQAIAKEKQVQDHQLFLFMTQAELGNYFKTKAIPKLEILKERRKLSALVFFQSDRPELFVGENAQAVEKAVMEVKETAQLQGNTAYPGKAKGISENCDGSKQSGRIQRRGHFDHGNDQAGVSVPDEKISGGRN